MSTHTDPPPANRHSGVKASRSRRPPARPSSVPRRPSPASDAELLVLVIDDDPLVIQVTRERLFRAGYRVITARTAQQALRALAERSPRIVLLDAMMPGTRDLPLLSELQDAELVSNVVLHSGLEREELSALARSTGALGAMQKTGDTAEFLLDFRRYWDSASRSSEPNVA